MRLDTALGRPILWSYPSNRFAVIGSAVGTVLLVIIRLIGRRPVTVGNVVGAFAALFLAWAVARELDPDENLSASIALVLAFVALLQFGFASAWLVGGVLLGTRLIVGTVGVSASPCRGDGRNRRGDRACFHKRVGRIRCAKWGDAGGARRCGRGNRHPLEWPASSVSDRPP